MRHLIALVVFITLGLATIVQATALEVISVPEDVNAVNLTGVVELRPGDGGRVQLSTAPGEDGIIRRIEVLASQPGTDPGWALLALRNDSDQQIERLLVAPFFRLPGSGIFQPDLGNDRITALTPSAGIRPVRLADSEADVFEITIDPGATVTLVAELASDQLPEVYLWQPNAYRDYVNSFTLFRGVVLGIASLAAVFLTIMFVVKGRGVFPATAAFAWAVLIYLLIDFSVLGRLLGLSSGAMQPIRAASEAGIATTLAGFLFIYLNLHRWHLRFIHLALGLAALFLALFAFAFFQPAIAATISRLVLALLGASGLVLIILLAVRGYDRAVLLVPTWIIIIAWLFYSWLVITGRVSNDIAQPAVAGGLVLVVMLLGFTAVQHAFSEGQVSIGTLSEVERRALALTGSGDFVFDWNIERDRVSVSDELATRLGEKRGALRGAIKRWLDRVHPEDRDRFRTAFDTLVELRRGKVSSDMRIAGHDGNYRSFRMRVKPVLGGDGQVNRIVGTLQDVTEDRASRARLLHDAVHDSLTGLPNKQLFLDRLERALVRARTPNGVKPAVFLIDIDRFMELEERVGHSAADSVLLAVSRRISRIMRPLDTVARIGGDQFAVILSSEHAAAKIADTAEQIRKALKAPFNFGDRDLALSASIGVTIYDSNPATAADVLRDAELAMYYAKRLGGDRIEAYRASARSISAYNRANEEDLERGMKQGELQVQFQPIMDIVTGQIAGAEALMRWNHPTRGIVPPEEFIALAERSGQIETLGRIAFEQAAYHTRDWLHQMRNLPESFFISVNMSPTQLATETLLNDIRILVQQNPGIAGHLKMELTESQIMTNPEHSAFMLEALRNLGLGLALDDFGTGHSSLSYLHRFPFDTIKIPADFVQIDADGASPTQVPIIRAVVALANDLDLLVVAEGVETLDEIERLRQLNCRYAQGFAFGAAMSASEFSKQLNAQMAR
ncbi:EAL domain-containing protein [Devosia rhodophyticola]|uniref:EAL domain-containing protein n=1 Tax=Devosia rhodophyticola TaxID=3026423 RepID=A0ABY7YZG2_9HYPH|nr:EAL domain-containing protein [Devosia rhodophyticola]WDR06552.1 EAL domain-containing protein [Devosia rhodophyticola]